MANDEERTPPVKKSPYIRMYCGYYTDARLAQVSLEAETLYLRGIAWSKAENLDGLVPERVVASLCFKFTIPPAVVTDELVDIGLWVPLDGGAGIPPEKWAEYQVTTARSETIRKGNRERALRYRAKKAAEANGDTTTGEEHHEPS